MLKSYTKHVHNLSFYPFVLSVAIARKSWSEVEGFRVERVTRRLLYLAPLGERSRGEQVGEGALNQ